MRHLLIGSVASLVLATPLLAQYGSFDPAAVKAAKGATLIVVLDAGDSPYNRAITDAVKSLWKFSPAFDFVTVPELGAQPIDPTKTYLLKTRRTDPVKFEGTFLTVVKGWKQKKGEALEQTDNAFTSIGTDHDLAYLLIDPKAINELNMAPILNVYIKHLQDYLKQVEAGKITDKTTADRLYDARSRLIREGELVIAREHLDKSLPDEGAIKTEYTAPFRVAPASELADAAKSGNSGTTVSDAVITIGDHKNKHCFKRVFNAGTGELMYLRDDAAIFGKKEGFIAEDFKAITRAR